MSITIKLAINQLERMKVKNYAISGYEVKELQPAFELAVTALREKEEREDPKPLTIDELKQMIGEPVYLVYAFAEPCEWVVFDHHNDDGFGTPDNSWWFAKGYGTAWIAYRHKPKEGNDGKM